jgi:hypothetical protein
MKTPAPDLDLTKITTQEPQVFLAWMPTRPDLTERNEAQPINVVPSIIIMPNASKAKDMREERFDRYDKASRPEELGRELNVSMLFSVYEPGIRLPGFVDSVNSEQGLDMNLIREGTEEGLFTLLDWMDECMEALLEVESIPGTDLFLHERSVIHSLYTDQNYVVDKRPIFYGFVNVGFGCYAHGGINRKVDALLD